MLFLQQADDQIGFMPGEEKPHGFQLLVQPRPNPSPDTSVRYRAKVPGNGNRIEIVYLSADSVNCLAFLFDYMAKLP